MQCLETFLIFKIKKYHSYINTVSEYGKTVCTMRHLNGILQNESLTSRDTVHHSKVRFFLLSQLFWDTEWVKNITFYSVSISRVSRKFQQSSKKQPESLKHRNRHISLLASISTSMLNATTSHNTWRIHQLRQPSAVCCAAGQCHAVRSQMPRSVRQGHAATCALMHWYERPLPPTPPTGASAVSREHSPCPPTSHSSVHTVKCTILQYYKTLYTFYATVKLTP